MVISPMKPFNGGIPMELSAAMPNTTVKIGMMRIRPPYSAISRVWRRS